MTNHWLSSTWRQTRICQGTVCFDMPGDSCFSTAQWPLLAIFITKSDTYSCLWCFWVRLNPSPSRKIPWCSSMECLCSSTQPAALIYLPSTCARLGTCLAGCPWCRAIWMATAHPRNGPRCSTSIFGTALSGPPELDPGIERYWDPVSYIGSEHTGSCWSWCWPSVRYRVEAEVVQRC